MPFESVTFAVKLLVPVAVGVPLITPVEEFRLRPAGKVPDVIAKVYGDDPQETPIVAE